MASNVMANFYINAIRDLAGLEPGAARVLDLGCGKGELVLGLRQLSVAAEGCDIEPFWSNDPDCLFRVIERGPYRLPYPDASFDAVLSSQVFEHAHNKRQCFEEIRRVLKPGGVAMHDFPPKWILPREPHMFVPLLNFFWPRRSRLWLALWALLGVRNQFQTDKPWREVVELNYRYSEDGIDYVANSVYRKISLEVFGNCEWPTGYLMRWTGGPIAKFFLSLPLQSLWEWLYREFRMAFLLQRKPASFIGEPSKTPAPVRR